MVSSGSSARPGLLDLVGTLPVSPAYTPGAPSACVSNSMASACSFQLGTQCRRS
jgi:hypothetical protein